MARAEREAKQDQLQAARAGLNDCLQAILAAEVYVSPDSAVRSEALDGMLSQLARTVHACDSEQSVDEKRIRYFRELANKAAIGTSPVHPHMAEC
jgi:hypothetical protein